MLVFALLPVASGAQARPPGGHPAQRSPTTADFPTGPAIGERLPDFVLPNQRGERVDFHADRAGGRAAVLFQRSAVW
jgi:hypothetical protein